MPRRDETPRNPDLAAKLRALAGVTQVGYTLTCGHTGSELGVRKGDLIFCPACSTSRTVRKIDTN
jgi:hypothetical protein